MGSFDITLSPIVFLRYPRKNIGRVVTRLYRERIFPVEEMSCVDYLNCSDVIELPYQRYHVMLAWHLVQLLDFQFESTCDPAIQLVVEYTQPQCHPGCISLLPGPWHFGPNLLFRRKDSPLDFCNIEQPAIMHPRSNRLLHPSTPISRDQTWINCHM